MSRRDSDSNSKHHRSRFDHRQPPKPTSPKRARRDGKADAERPASMLNMDSVDRDQKHHRRLQGSVPVDTTVATDLKIESELLSKASDKKSNGYRETAKNSSGNIEDNLSRSHYQHDERDGQGRSYRHRETKEREGWKDSRDRQSGRATNRSSANDDTKVRDEKTRYDGSYKGESALKQTSKKRPSFRETKLPVDAGTSDKSATQVTKAPVNNDGSERKEERGNAHRSEMQRTRFESSERNGGGSFRGRDRFNGQSGGRVDKWKHDLYDEANKSPNTKNEEDQIAKVEALLAS